MAKVAERMTMKEKLFEKITAHRPRTTKLNKEFGNIVIDQVTIAQAIGGARGIRSLVTDISYLDPEEGIRFRGMTIPESFAALPKAPGSEYPFVEGFFYFLMTGDVPTMEQTLAVVEDFKTRARIPQYVFDVLRAMPRDTHPMTMFSAAILAMQRESIFTKRYAEGMSKMEYWDPMYEDACNLMAKLPAIGAYIYRIKYKGDTPIAPDPKLDLGGNFAHMMGIGKPYDDVARMYFCLHSDHESGNVSAHTGHLVASALSDAYYAYSAAINGLAGPLHGLANQEVLGWCQGVFQKLGGKLPTEEELKKFLWDTLKSGQVIPGYGHAVLRKTDPRYVSQMEFCLKNLPDYPLFKLVNLIYKVAPGVLMEHGKAKNPWPNVDAQSGVIQWYYGVVEYDFYTVLFGIGRALGVLANLTWDAGSSADRFLRTEMKRKTAGGAGFSPGGFFCPDGTCSRAAGDKGFPGDNGSEKDKDFGPGEGEPGGKVPCLSRQETEGLQPLQEPITCRSREFTEEISVSPFHGTSSRHVGSGRSMTAWHSVQWKCACGGHSPSNREEDSLLVRISRARPCSRRKFRLRYTVPRLMLGRTLRASW
jgi:citrate synthase